MPNSPARHRNSALEPEPITQLLDSWQRGDEAAANRLLSLVYPLLRAAAARHLEASGGVMTQQPRDIVQEAYLSLVQQTRTEWQNREHFFAIASRLMRRIVIDHLRSRSRQKRGGHALRIPLHEARGHASVESIDWLVVDEALRELEAVDERTARVVELRFFVGCTVEEVAAALNISRSTVEGDWRVAKAWLKDHLSR